MGEDKADGIVHCPYQYKPERCDVRSEGRVGCGATYTLIQIDLPLTSSARPAQFLPRGRARRRRLPPPPPPPPPSPATAFDVSAAGW